ncbi:hypothetical protein Acr_16g0000700 [Actinidia rufa]|uniref:Uncharacterized protein n=1 Tax=Actinidia rufa TaxID=165716 RepID=A0A7J0FXQ0_9ERIC|nr:hypothetical protein Acr_16g0000700 [Actinidia rufa]
MGAARGSFAMQVILCPLTCFGIAVDRCLLINPQLGDVNAWLCYDRAQESIVPLPRFVVRYRSDGGGGRIVLEVKGGSVGDGIGSKGIFGYRGGGVMYGGRRVVMCGGRMLEEAKGGGGSDGGGIGSRGMVVEMYFGGEMVEEAKGGGSGGGGGWCNGSNGVVVVV